MDRQGSGRLGRVVLFFLLLNVLAAAAGTGLEYWRSQPRALPAFNADKIKLRGVVEGPEAKAAPKPVPQTAEEAVPAE